MKRSSAEYALIKRWYGDQRAKRSGLPLINHINEGIDLLVAMGASERAIQAFCLHPLAQSDSDVAKEMIWKTPGIRRATAQLAMMYAKHANSYLCRPETDHYTVDSLNEHVGWLSQDLIHMLAADKLQNEKDFNLYHKATHPRSEQLARYFCIWLDYLDEVELIHKASPAV
jgi:hypothetical protein